MKRKLNSVYLLFAVLLIAYLQMSSSNNPQNGYTGAPPSGNTCASSQGGCHSGGSGTGMVTITGLPSTVTPNTVYPLTITVERTNNDPQETGLQMVAQQSNNSNAGVLSNPGSQSTVQFSGSKYYFEHTSPKSFSGNTATYTVDWTAPATSNGGITLYVAANLADGNGSSTGDAIVTSTATTTLSGGGGNINVTVTGTNVSCFNGNNGSATANASGGGGGPYNYAWSNGGSTQTINNLTAGTYTVTVTNAAGGSGTGSTTISQPPQLQVAITNQINITCSNPIGSATAQASGGTTPYTYTWSNGQTGPTATLNAGSHTVSVTDGNACVATANVNITSDVTPPLAEAGPPAAITCSVPTPTLNGSGSSTGGNISYLWTTADGVIVSGANTLNPVVSAAGTYLLLVTNTSNGCTATDFTTVSTNNTPPNSNAGQDGLLTCTTTQVTLNGSASSQGSNFTYLWTTADGNIVSGATTLMVVVDEPGTYCLTVTNTLNGCTDTDCASVLENTTPPLANAGSAPPLTCTTIQVTLNGSASSQGPEFTYLWTTNNGNIVSGATTLSPVVNQIGAYILTVTNTTNGCTASSSVTVTSNTTPPTASAGPDRALNCNNTSVVLDGSGSSQGPNFTYLWTGPGIQSGGTTPNPTVNAAGSYIILVTNTATGCTKTDTAAVVQTPALSAAIAASQNILCNGANTGSATVAGSGGKAPYTYAWSNSSNTAQINNLAAGTYTATITDADNCTATATAIITQPPVLNPNTSSTGETSVGSNDGTATANPIGGVPDYTYTWSTGANTASINGLAPGNYTVSVTDANGCTVSQVVTVASFSCSGFESTMSSTNPSCNGSSNGTASVNVSGGTAPFEYLWSNDSTTATINNLPAGSYTVSVTDENGCVVTGNITLIAPTSISLTTQQSNVVCNGGNNGTASIEATGGTPGYTYEWSNGGTEASQSNLAAGSYTISVTDANGCESSAQVSISEPPSLVGAITTAGESGVNTDDGTASIAASGGVAPYEYLWSDGSTASAITDLEPGIYCVSVTDANGCVFTGCGTVTAFGCVGQSLEFTAQNVGCAGGNNGAAQVIASGFADPLTFLWSNGGTGNAIGNLTAGDYAVSVTDANGCATSGTVSITEPAVLEVESLGQTNLQCAGSNEGAITVSGIGGTPTYAYSWSTGATSPTLSNLPAGVYEVSISDDNNCTATASFEITVLPDTEAPTAVAINLTAVNLSADGIATITPQMIGGGSVDNCGSLTLSLDKTEFNCNEVGENTVTLTVTDAAGNTSTALATVLVIDNLAPVINCPQNLVFDNISCEVLVNYDTPIATDNCGFPLVSLTDGPLSGSNFPLGVNTVTWTALDVNGNSANCSFTVTVNGDYSVSTSFTMPSCNGGDNGTATAIVTGGVPPYAFLWNDPASQQAETATGLAAGTYSVSVTDASGCVSVQSVEVEEPAAISLVIDQVQDAIGGPNGFIQINVSGGAGGYTYEWTLNGAFYSDDEDLEDLWDGEYTLVVTDAQGCTQSIIVEITFVNATAEKALENQVTLAPNPSSGRVFLNFSLDREYHISYQVFNLAGKTLMPEQKAFAMSNQVELNLSHATAGVYFVRVIVGEEAVVKRLVIGN